MTPGRLQLDNLAKICEVLGVEITDVLELRTSVSTYIDKNCLKNY
ncbi:helix-turn-helix domain-containing protein [Brevibacillus laterosporus]|nr:helix-turn-helix domain-containing protein [Brevibacillus laterosporus]MCR8938088.1 helix-turn-helix domain-containing protein [Brevibacillus laterosporus]MCZ0840728.1 helix-turn-helix domain-containing protein [Brevibacillus laterosporus]MCZ0847408.1 helix-turn-helix domain-containing protein [Brevibacillus laterosporus]